MAPGSERIYLDHNATTPLHPEVVEAMTAVLRHAAGNPSSTHAEGAEATASALFKDRMELRRGQATTAPLKAAASV